MIRLSEKFSSMNRSLHHGKHWPPRSCDNRSWYCNSENVFDDRRIHCIIDVLSLAALGFIYRVLLSYLLKSSYNFLKVVITVNNYLEVVITVRGRAEREIQGERNKKMMTPTPPTIHVPA